MTIPLRLLFVFAITLFVTGCSRIVALNEVDDSHIVGGSLTTEQVKTAIIVGAQNAGWFVKDLGDDKIVATFRIRSHTVHVDINFTNSFYVTRYKSSNNMKVFCTEQEKSHYRNIKVTGRQNCPGNRTPMYIHGSYKRWVDTLNLGIQSSLASM